MSESSQILKVSVEEELKKSYLDYAMSVIVGRALPDVRDGLKPVQRRCIYAMNDLGNAWNKAYMKSARIVGHVTGRYHPHGDGPAYDTIVRLAQPFTMRYMLVDGQGNFGSVDGDSPAAMRYTEIRMKKLSHELIADLDKDTVNFSPNYDNTTVIPDVFPTKFPNLLINGTAGIAVGMATNIPPHHLGEIMEALIHMIDHPDCSLTDLLPIIPGPDFPTGGIINGTSGIKEAYRTGRGKFYTRARSEIIDIGPDKQAIIVHELPYQVNKARLIEKIAMLVRDKKITTISAIRDESDREGMRMVIEIKRGENAEVTLNQLYTSTPMQNVFGMNMVALDGNQPRCMGLFEILTAFLNHRRVVVRRRTLYELRKAIERGHILEGLAVAVSNLDPVITMIREANSSQEAKEALLAQKWPTQNLSILTEASKLCRPEGLPMNMGITADHFYCMSPEQAQAILDMRLHRLTGLERDKITAEYSELLKKIEYLNSVLGSYSELMRIIREECIEIKDQFTDQRQTEILENSIEMHDLDMIPNEQVLVTISSEGYIKSQPLDVYQAQKRGGKGKSSAKIKDADYVRYLHLANRHDCLLSFTNKGRLYWLNVYEISLSSRQSKGKPLVNHLQLMPDETVSAILPVSDFNDHCQLLMVTAFGYVKKVDVSVFSKPRSTGIIACDLIEGDHLVNVLQIKSDEDVLLFSSAGKVIRFNHDQIRVMGRSARGVKGMRLQEGQRIISALVANESASILTASENGYGKRTALNDIRKTNRSGQGVTAMSLNDKTGSLVKAENVTEEDDLVLITDQGTLVRTRISEIRSAGRVTQGVRLINLSSNEKLIDVCRIMESDESGEDDKS
ncbi:DNA gyrase subunit A [Gammaproteobacteria bacterium]|nr:DNA gyrase subunit A [Gammaproteobacteria bacterium]